MTVARIRAVVVDHDGGALTVRCIESLRKASWRGERDIVLVDNASASPVPAAVLDGWPDVRVVRTTRNTGFAGGANEGLRDLDDVDAVALVNNDAVVAPDFLDPLATALERDPHLGAACPKIRFTGRSRQVELAAPAVRHGARVHGVRVHEIRSPGGRVHLVDGFWDEEFDDHGHLFRWTAEHARLYVASDGDTDGAVRLELLVSAPADVPLRMTTGERRGHFDVGPEPRWVAFEPAGASFAVINNVGTVVRPDWYGVDRGYLEIDEGQYDGGGAIEAWCGGAVLLRAEYVRAVGGFDDRLFLYYEDVELSLRGRAAGWRYELVPASVVEHEHSATAISGSDRAEFYKERNRLVVVWWYAGPRTFASLLVRHLAATASYARRDLLVPLLHGRRPHFRFVRRRLRSVVAVVPLVVSGRPRSRRRRRRPSSR